MEEASRFGILETDEKGRITAFKEKPKKPMSNLASMGVYIFTYKVLRAMLIADAKDPESEHDFGKNIIPTMLESGRKLMAYTYRGYWKDVGTVSSLHEANMDLLLSSKSGTSLESIQNNLKIYSEDSPSKPQYIGPKASVHDCLINQGAVVLGKVESCVISGDTLIEEGAEVVRTVVMSGVTIEKNAKVFDAIIAPGVTVEAGKIINEERAGIALISSGKVVR